MRKSFQTIHINSFYFPQCLKLILRNWTMWSTVRNRRKMNPKLYHLCAFKQSKCCLSWSSYNFFRWYTAISGRNDWIFFHMNVVFHYSEYLTILWAVRNLLSSVLEEYCNFFVNCKSPLKECCNCFCAALVLPQKLQFQKHKLAWRKYLLTLCWLIWTAREIGENNDGKNDYLLLEVQTGDCSKRTSEISL